MGSRRRKALGGGCQFCSRGHRAGGAEATGPGEASSARRSGREDTQVGNGFHKPLDA